MAEVLIANKWGHDRALSGKPWILFFAIEAVIGILFVFSPYLSVVTVFGVALFLLGAYTSPTLVYALILLSIPSQYTTHGTRGMADIKLVHFATAAGIIAWALQWVKRKTIEIDIRWMDVPILLFIGWAVTSALWSVDPQRTLFFDIKLIGAFATYFVLIFLIRDKVALNRVLLIWLVVYFLWSVAGLYTMLFVSIPEAEKVKIAHDVVTKLGKTVRVSAVFANPNELAFFLSIATIVAVVNYRIRPSKFWKILAVVSILVASAVLLGTFSRKSWLAILLSVSILSIKDRRVLLACLVIGLLSFVFVVGWVGSDRFVEALYNRFSSFLLEPEVAMEERVASWTIAMDLFVRAPLIGSGAGAYYALAPAVGSELPIPHNLYVLLLVEYGLVGLGIFLLISCVFASGLIRIMKVHKDPQIRYVALGLFAVLVSVLFQAFFKTLAFTNYNFLCFFALLSSFLRIHGCGNTCREVRRYVS
ncbi:MAG: O-antigen ligase family protein [Deltaproteobacteria bacterium]|nr:O-antigen ligase family protein [Deltaproteobacteria bacterium]